MIACNMTRVSRAPRVTPEAAVRLPLDRLPEATRPGEPPDAPPRRGPLTGVPIPMATSRWIIPRADVALRPGVPPRSPDGRGPSRRPGVLAPGHRRRRRGLPAGRLPLQAVLRVPHRPQEDRARARGARSLPATSGDVGQAGAPRRGERDRLGGDAGCHRLSRGVENRTKYHHEKDGDRPPTGAPRREGWRGTSGMPVRPGLTPSTDKLASGPPANPLDPDV